MTAAPVDLPPLPEPEWASLETGDQSFSIEQMHEYATAAILADRAARPEAKAAPELAAWRCKICGGIVDLTNPEKPEVFGTAGRNADQSADARDRVIAQHILALRQLLDIWDAGMPDETARPDMVEAFNAVRAAMLETPTKEAT